MAYNYKSMFWGRWHTMPESIKRDVKNDLSLRFGNDMDAEQNHG